MNLEYLNGIVQYGENALYVKNLSQISALLRFVLTERKTGNTLYIQPTKKNIFHLLKASSAIPFLYSSVFVGGMRCLDGGLSDPLPFTKAKSDGYEDITVVYNGPIGFSAGDRYDTVSRILALFLPRKIGALLKTRADRLQKIERQLEVEKNLKVIRPKKHLPLKSILDSNKDRMNASFDRGVADAKEFLRTYHT